MSNDILLYIKVLQTSQVNLNGIAQSPEPIYMIQPIATSSTATSQELAVQVINQVQVLLFITMSLYTSFLFIYKVIFNAIAAYHPN